MVVIATDVAKLPHSLTFDGWSLAISKDPEKTALKIRAPTTHDAGRIWQLVRGSGGLDVNSAYLYLLLCRDFSETCLVACLDESVVGFVTGYRPPREPAVLFIWQVGVAPEAKRQGVASRLLCELIQRCGADTISAIEATVTSSNIASRRLFESLARTLDLPLVNRPDEGFHVSDFPPGDHEAEPRIRIGH